MTDYDTLTEKIRRFTEKSVKKSRYEHSLRVADMCVRICRQYALDEKKGRLAGIGHDMCKDFSDKRLLSLAKKDGAELTGFELEKPSLLHGRAAAVLMQEKFGVTDADVLEAVAVHTSGRSGMCALAKCLFVADKIEPGRPQVTDEYLARKFSLSFDALFYDVLAENYNYLMKKGLRVFPGTERLLEEYRAEGELL